MKVYSKNGFEKHFYKLPMFDFISKTAKRGSIVVHNEICYIARTFDNRASLSVFDKNGVAIEEKTFDCITENLNAKNRMNVIDNKLYVCLDKQIARFQLK
jgi:hypothetical protein